MQNYIRNPKNRASVLNKVSVFTVVIVRIRLKIFVNRIHKINIQVYLSYI